MRTSTAVIGAAAGLALAFGIAGTAGAAAPDQAAPSPSTAGSPAAVFVSTPTATPGQTVRVDGTCALPATGPLPTVVSVTSPAFTDPEVFSKTDPNAFDGTATVRSNAAPGPYPVTLTCSNGTATTTFQVVPGHGGNSGGGTSGTNSGSNAGGSGETPIAPANPAQAPAAQPADHSGNDSIAIGVTAVAIVAAGGAGYVAVSRRRRSGTGRHRDHAGV